jgi:glycyl-tRNA synthetase beta chain
MADSHAFLVELGTEELPPKALSRLSDAFREGVVSGLAEASLEHGEVRAYATPRRLALRIDGLAVSQPDRQLERRGPPLKVAVDTDGAPTQAGRKFAEGCGVPFDELGRLETPKGDYLLYEGVEVGRPAAELVAGIVGRSLGALPVPRPMHWADNDFVFVRPVHWLVMMLDGDVVSCELYGQTAGRSTRGHRFHSPAAIEITAAGDYPACLGDDAFVIPDFAVRREVVRAATDTLASELGGRAIYDDGLLDEVTALVEWPVAIAGRFDAHFLELPREVLVSTLQAHQRYFPVEDGAGALMDRFITISNLESRDPEQVVHGNERVVRPRLADAAFFFDSDRRTTLADRRESLRNVVFQRALGSLHDKSARVAALAGDVARSLGYEPEPAVRAAELAKCDLVTDMVGEFPDLQGIMGRYYARHDGESDAVAQAIEEQYLPRFAGDDLPATETGRVVAIAEKLDTLAGIFGIGQRPTGTRDPFGLRRSALGVLRILIEGEIELDLAGTLRAAAGRIPGVEDTDALATELFDYMMDRLRAYYLDGVGALQAPIEVFEAVLDNRPASPLDFHRRVEAVLEFARLPAATSLAAANKRVANILRKAGLSDTGPVDPAQLVEAEEKALHERVVSLAAEVGPLLARREYRAALERLATLREPVDAFFDSVMVMAEDEGLRNNRLALLGQMRGLFLQTADLSRLGG